MTDISEDAKTVADREIKAKQREVKYDLRDFTIAFLVDQFRQDVFYIPDYQRAFVWPERHRCRFIESVLLGLPIPMMFVADMEDGRLEIVDGAQRIQTLESFTSNDLELSKLEKLASLNGFRYSDLPVSQQRKFGTKALRIVVLEDSTSPETRQEIFDRVNTSQVKARASEIRRGAHPGPLMTFIQDCAGRPLFEKLCPVSETLRRRREPQELVLRFFAYSDRYKEFRHDVERFLTQFVKDHQTRFSVKRFENEFTRMLEFVQKFFPFGFAKGSNARTTPRVRFEAISVGVNLALRERPDLVPPDPHNWLGSPDFERHTTTHASNSQPRLRGRIEFVRDHLLGKERE